MIRCWEATPVRNGEGAYAGLRAVAVTRPSRPQPDGSIAWNAAKRCRMHGDACVLLGGRTHAHRSVRTHLTVSLMSAPACQDVSCWGIWTS